MALRIETEDAGGDWLIKVEGEIDLYTSPELRTAISKTIPKSRKLVGVDLSKVEYMDSSGVATLVEGLRTCTTSNKEFVLVSPSQPVMKVLQLSRLDSVFQVRDKL